MLDLILPPPQPPGPSGPPDQGDPANEASTPPSGATPPPATPGPSPAPAPEPAAELVPVTFVPKPPVDDVARARLMAQAAMDAARNAQIISDLARSVDRAFAAPARVVPGADDSAIAAYQSGTATGQLPLDPLVDRTA